MGIPKFFRWMTERYPGLLKTAKERELPEIDNFYLDMNGIIHNCTHPNDGDVHFRISEQEMFEDIFNYVNTLFGIMKPKEFFFLAVDGVAPRAKMNQQRGRRFRSAKEAFDREEAARIKGDILPTESRFDSNCITPGTEFMVRLNEALKKFIKTKLSTDPEWRHVKVILSGHETPGEGEHKIMDFIRYQRSQSSYDPATRHCLYGLDTDLIMLALSSHEPNFLLLREEIKFNNKKDATRGKSQRVDPSKINFNVLYLKQLRRCILEDFLPLKSEMSFKWDLEGIIDDWILICFLVGNDFIPHIPHFHIHKSALPRIFEVYQSTLTKIDGYLNENGVLNLKRFRVFARALADVDFDNYKILLKENGGECAKDDFSKLNMFVRQRMRITGVRDNQHNNGRRYKQNSYEGPTHHSHYHQSNVWFNIQSRNARLNGMNHGQRRQIHTASHQEGRPVHDSKPGYVDRQASDTKPAYNGRLNHDGAGGGSGKHAHNGRPTHDGKPAYNGRSANDGRPTHNGKANYNGKVPNGTPANGRVGVHSFTEEQINNSITVCADGDFIDLSDEEYLSDEKFPGEKSPAYRNGIRNERGVNHRSTPKKGSVAKPKDPAKFKRSNEMDDFQAYKRTYYREKLKLDPDKESVLKVVHEYVRALQWNLHYYYHGCVSWGWFYPYHYAPFISDIVDFKSIDVEFEMGEPFKPYDQLLSVLPAASMSLLPRVYRSLVTEGSPLAKYFPAELEYDLNGKQNDWEAVVLAPFIDQESLLKATVLLNLFLSDRERQTNKHGPHVLFCYEGPNQTSGGNKNPRSAVAAGRVKCLEIAPNGFFLSRDKIKFGLLAKPQKRTSGGLRSS